MTYAEKLTEIIKSNGNGTIVNTAKDVGLPQSSLSHWSRGIRKPNKKALQKIVSHFKLPQDYFVDCDFEDKSNLVQKRGYQSNSNSDLKTNIPKKTWVMHHTKKIPSDLSKITKKYENMVKDLEHQELELMQKLEGLDEKKRLIKIFVKDLLNETENKTEVTTI